MISLVPGVSQPGYPEATYTAAQSSHPNASLYPVVNFGPQYATGQIQNQQQSYSTLYQPPVYQYLPPSEFPEKQASAPPPPSYDEVIHWLYVINLRSRETFIIAFFESHCVLWFLQCSKYLGVSVVHMWNRLSMALKFINLMLDFSNILSCIILVKWK